MMYLKHALSDKRHQYFEYNAAAQMSVSINKLSSTTDGDREQGRPHAADIIASNRTPHVDDHGDSQPSDNASVLDDDKVTVCSSDSNEPAVDDFASLATWQSEAS